MKKWYLAKTNSLQACELSHVILGLNFVQVQLVALLSSCNSLHCCKFWQWPISSELFTPYSFHFLSFCTFLSSSFFATPFMMVLHNKVLNLGRGPSCYSSSSTFFVNIGGDVASCCVTFCYIPYFLWHNKHNTTITFTNACSISFYLFFPYS